MKKKGMTLIELIISLSIVVVVMTFFVASYGPIFSLYGTGKSLATAKAQSTQMLNVIKREIRTEKKDIIVTDTYNSANHCLVSRNNQLFKQTGSNSYPPYPDLPDKLYKATKECKITFKVIESNGVKAIEVSIVVDGYSVVEVIKPDNPDAIISSKDTSGPLLCYKKP